MMNKEEFFRRLGIYKISTVFKTFSHQGEENRRREQIKKGMLKAENGVVFFRDMR